MSDDELLNVVFYILLDGVIFGLIGRTIGRSRGKTTEGFLFGFLLGPIGLIIFLLVLLLDGGAPAPAAPVVVEDEPKKVADIGALFLAFVAGGVCTLAALTYLNSHAGHPAPTAAATNQANK